MYLKSLEIQGFKSFTDRTLILFHQGVTAIVGPNGSGKSNVTDAIRWVLGEQSAKALRGGKMEDVIFAGTNTRRPLGFAEVTMLIDNSDGKLPIEYNEVAISRRLYRSGESNYLINQNPCRLKDIHNLFMDTGLGRDGYSIIGQGRVDEILSTRSEDRRKVFEEASGIQKYKTRRDEAVRKLEQTENNLTRVNDILSELSGQLLPLKKQAEQAKQYLLWYEELKEAEVSLTLHSIDTKGQQSKDEQLKLETATADAEAALQESLLLEDSHRKIRTRLEELNIQLQEARRNKDLRNQEREAALAQTAELRSQKDQNRLEQASRVAALQQIKEQKEALAAELELRQAQANEDSKRLVEAEEVRVEKQKAFQAFIDLVQEKIEAQANLREQLSQYQNELLEIRSARSKSMLAGEQLTHLLSEMSEQAERADFELKELQAELSKQKDLLSSLNDEDNKQQAELIEHETELTELKQSLTELQANYNTQVQQLDQLGYKLDTLREMQSNMEGYNDAVRFVLEYSKNDRVMKSAVKGSIGSLVNVSGEYERALETALGVAIQNIVVEDEKTASLLITVLKNERKGRATFLPLNRVKPRYLANDVINRLEKHREQGFLGLAHDLLSYPAEIASAVELLLARTVIAQNLAAATRLAESFGQSLKIVTLEGEVINPGGAMTGGQYKNQSSILSRKRLLAEALEQYKTYEKLLPKTEQRIEQKMQQVRSEGTALEATAQSALILKQKLAFQEAQTAQLELRIKNTEESIVQINARIRELKNQEEGSGDALSELTETENRKLAEIKHTEEAIRKQDEINSSYALERENLRDAVAKAEAAHHLLEQNYQAEQKIDERIHAEDERLDLQFSEHEAQLQALQATDIKIEQGMAEAESVLLNLSSKAGSEEQKLLQWETEQQELDARSAELFDTLRTQSATLSALELEKNRLETRIEQLTLQLDDLRNKLWENYYLTYDNAAQFRVENLQAAVVGPKVQSLKQSIRSLGAVNVNAVEDYQLLEERHSFLKKQEEDILTAKTQLDQLVSELTLVMREQFRENFSKINENFQTVFRELFGGGKAEINLEAGKDILEGDIEIKASPPGKKLQNMLLLSGGERALAAIALLFAILKLRPTPFCVLDEIEAALDDSNVFRFTDYIKNYADNSQFILVTHRKGTMEAADSIYGVTMQELGVSRILSLELGD